MATRIDLQRLQELLANDAQLIEVLPSAEYTKEQLPGTISLPLKELDAATASMLDRTRPVVVYCWDGCET
jgi:rhodanese-related sulfurtransferase